MRRTGLGLALTAAFALVLLGLQEAEADPLPTIIGTCTKTTIEEIGTRLGTPDSGSVVTFINGGVQISYDPDSRDHQFAGRRSGACLPGIYSAELPAGRRSRQDLSHHQSPHRRELGTARTRSTPAAAPSLQHEFTWPGQEILDYPYLADLAVRVSPCFPAHSPLPVMAGLVPAIHDLFVARLICGEGRK